jgi:ATP-dependent DNA helicase RecG
MPETQNVEYKESWHDEYLKWICGFTNAQGGVIYIGKDDLGNVVGVKNYKRLMDDIPNKIRDTLGITAVVNLRQEGDHYFIEIITPPYSVPISLRGKYYFRSGSTKHELTGASLNEFLLRKSGRSWDDVIEPRATIDDIDEKSFRHFLHISQEKGRLPVVDGLSTKEILQKLRLTENNQLKRAAIILFGKDPGMFYPNTFVKIGRFAKNDADLRFHEVEEGNLMELLRDILELLNHKFLTRPIEFEGLYRVEKGEYPHPAIREMLLNALVHRNYMGAQTQIRVYDDKIMMWNDGHLPEGISLDALKRTHSSKPRNPIIADVCFKGGLIDSWGRGTLKIIETCKSAELPEPEFTERDGGFAVTLFKDNLTKEQLRKLGLNERQVKALLFIKEKGRITNSDYQNLNAVSKRTATNDLSELVDKFKLIKNIGFGAGSFYKLRNGQ